MSADTTTGNLDDLLARIDKIESELGVLSCYVHDHEKRLSAIDILDYRTTSHDQLIGKVADILNNLAKEIKKLKRSKKEGTA